MQTITLNRWFQKNTSRPIALVGIFVFLVWIILLWALNTEISAQQREGARELANLLNLSFSQKNRVLTESLLSSSHVNFAAEAAAVCQGGKVIIASNADNSYCGEPGSFLFPKMAYLIPGNDDFRLVTTFSRFGDRMNIWRFLIFGLIVTGACYVVLFKMRQRFRDDIFLPFQAGMFDDKPMLIEELEEIRQKRKVIEEAKEREAMLQGILQNKNKVAHNIKSPLRTLQLIQQALRDQIPERQSKLFDGAVESINHILGDQQAPIASPGQSAASGTGVGPTQTPGAVLISDFLDETLAQKSAEYAKQRNISISVDHSAIPFGAFVQVVKHEFRAILSNLINNAVDAIGKKSGSVQIIAAVENGVLRITVNDTGCGVPDDRREKIFEEGVTFKVGGNGVGLFHARQYLARWSGSIECVPVADGASFAITLPTVKAPAWFADRIGALTKRNVVVLDDNRLIHRIWKDRFQSMPEMAGAKFHFLSSEEEFEACLGEIASEVSETIILCDYDLNLSNRTGLDILRAYGVSSIATLVTNNFNSGELIRECGKERIRILPKPCIHSVPITA